MHNARESAIALFKEKHLTAIHFPVSLQTAVKTQMRPLNWRNKFRIFEVWISRILLAFRWIFYAPERLSGTSKLWQKQTKLHLILKYLWRTLSLKGPYSTACNDQTRRSVSDADHIMRFCCARIASFLRLTGVNIHRAKAQDHSFASLPVHLYARKVANWVWFAFANSKMENNHKVVKELFDASAVILAGKFSSPSVLLG